MEVLADKIEPLIRAGCTHLRGQKRGASASAVGGNSQTLKLHRPRQLPELTSTMNSRTIESTLDGWKTPGDSDLPQHSLTKAASKLPKKTRETVTVCPRLSYLPGRYPGKWALCSSLDSRSVPLPAKEAHECTSRVAPRRRRKRCAWHAIRYGRARWLCQQGQQADCHRRRTGPRGCGGAALV